MKEQTKSEEMHEKHLKTIKRCITHACGRYCFVLTHAEFIKLMLMVARILKLLEDTDVMTSVTCNDISAIKKARWLC